MRTTLLRSVKAGNNMKRYDMRRYWIAILLLLVAHLELFAEGVRPVRVEMNDRKYFFFQFPSEIKYADMGSADLKAEKCLYGNVLKLKAEIPYFEKTNLSVVTTDGKYYSFIVEYDPNPPYLALDMAGLKDSIRMSDVIPSVHIEVSDLNTTHLIFPSKVGDISIGYDNVISEKAEDIDNIVKVKSVLGEQDEFFQTSLTVVTVDGKIYPMVVDYKKNPQRLSYSFAKSDNALFRGVNVNDENMRRMSEWVIAQGQEINDLGAEGNKMMFQLTSVFTDQDIIAFHLYAKNSSRIDYAIDFVKAYIRDKKITKKTAVQEQEIYPIYVFYSEKDKVVKGKEGIDIVMFYKKFTIPQKRMLYFELFEDNGGRHIKFTAPNKVIIKAKVMDKIE